MKRSATGHLDRHRHRRRWIACVSHQGGHGHVTLPADYAADMSGSGMWQPNTAAESGNVTAGISLVSPEQHQPRPTTSPSPRQRRERHLRHHRQRRHRRSPRHPRRHRRHRPRRPPCRHPTPRPRLAATTNDSGHARTPRCVIPDWFDAVLATPARTTGRTGDHAEGTRSNALRHRLARRRSRPRFGEIDPESTRSLTRFERRSDAPTRHGGTTRRPAPTRRLTPPRSSQRPP